MRMLLGVAVAAPLYATAAGGTPSLLELSIEELGEIEVTSVSRRGERLSDAPASIYVITRAEILRSGVTSIPEALRLAPAVEVARNGTHSWTISLRGFSSDLSNKLLVLIDGRSVYSPLFAGVYWDAQDTLLEDIERIEVIAGPGGTSWGSNAVNGVINIITRSAADTQGGFVQLGAGDEDELIAGLRYGGRSDGLAWRAYAKHFERDASRDLEGGGSAGDDWEMDQAGFRMDRELTAADALTLQGDVYDGKERALLRTAFTLGTLPENVPGTVEVSGHNVLGRWSRQLRRGGEVKLQAFYDHTARDIPGSFTERRSTGDLELLHDLAAPGRHDWIWGAGLRITADDIDSTRFASFDPESRTDETYNVFVQDKIDLHEARWYLTLGTKLEHNDYSGFEHQPNVRLAWLPKPNQTVWAAVSRAVRIPARLNEDLELFAPVPGLPLPLYLNVRSDEDFEPEELIAYELGYRVRVGTVSANFATFYHDYDHLMTNEVLSGPTPVAATPPYLLLPIVQGNGMRGQTYGGTLDLKWQPHPAWRLELQLSHLEFDLELRTDSSDTGALAVAGNSPEYQAALYSYLELPRGLSFFTGVRYVDELPNQGVPSYVAVDAHLQWQVTPRLSAALTVRNLDDPRHPEFGEGREIERSTLFKLDWVF